MKDVLVGTSATLRVDFTSPLGSVAADVGSVTYSLYDQSGALLSGPTSVTIPSGATGANISISSGSHTITGGRKFEKRTLIVNYTSNGEGRSARLVYRVTPLHNYWTSPDEVRALLGLNADELMDEEIDLFSAYIALDAELGGTVLSDALATGTSVETAANQLLAVDAALLTVSSLQLRTPMVQADGSKRFERFRTPPDWDRIVGDLAAMRGDLLAVVSETTAATLTIAVVAQPTDAVTGV